VPAKKPSLNQPTSSNQGVGRAIALFDFNAVEVRVLIYFSLSFLIFIRRKSGDLSFSKGQVIVLTEKSLNTNTWYV
jgi:hypothetical protein